MSFNRRTLTVIYSAVACGLVLVLLVARCSRNDDESSSAAKPKATIRPSASPSLSPSPTVQPGIPIFTKDQLQKALLSPAEVGTGFRVTQAPDTSEDKGPSETDNQHCTDLARKGLDPNLDPAAEINRQFSSSEQGPVVIQNVASFRAINDASVAVQQFQALSNECTTWTETEGSEATTYTVTKQTLAKYGEESSAVVLELAGHSLNVQVRFVMLRIGNNACMLLITSDSIVSDSDVDFIAENATQKLRSLTG